MRVLVLAFAACAGCISPPPLLYCLRDKNCSDSEHRDSHCIYDGDSGAYCADKDNDCSSGFRWSIGSPKNLIGACVDPALLLFDASVPG